MNLRYTTLLLPLGLAQLMQAQHPAVSRTFPTRQPDKHPAVTGTSLRPVAAPSQASLQREAFYSEDFSGGAIPAGWTNVDDLTPPNEDPVFFEWSNDPTAVEVAAVSYPDLVGTFNAPGAANGYVWANSDRGLSSAPSTQHTTRLTTSAIDCSGQTSVLLTMQSVIGVFNNNANEFVKVKVGTDLTNWVEYFPFPCLEAGSPTPPCSRFSANPESVAINISDAAAGQATVYIQFEWQGDWEYYWAIDDLALSPVPDSEIVMNYGFTSTTGSGEEYGRIPLLQMPATMNIGAELFNFGLVEQTNVVVNCHIEDADGTEVYNDVVPGLTNLPSQTTSTYEDDIDVSGLGLGLYTADFTLSSDQSALDLNPDNNARTRTFEVTQDIYSLDNLGNHPEGTQVTEQVGSGSFTDNSENVKLMNMYYINTAVSVTGVEIALGSATDPGSMVVVSVIDTVDALASPSVVNDYVNGLVSDEWVITQADIDQGVASIPFIEPAVLNEGAYYVVASLFADGDNNVYVLDDVTVPQPPLASALWIPFDPENNQNFYGGNGTAWAVRLSTSLNVSAPAPVAPLGTTIFPNPTKGILNFRSLDVRPQVITVYNILSELVMTNTFIGATSIDLSSFAKGVYMVEVTNGGQRSVERVVVE